jgi:hypothetical protein
MDDVADYHCTLSSVLSKSQTLTADKLFYFLQVLRGRCKISTTEDKARKKRILLVDDELAITVTLKIALEASGFFQVEAFYDISLSALSLCSSGQYILLLALALVSDCYKDIMELTTNGVVVTDQICSG